MTITCFTLLAIAVSLVSCCTAPSCTPQSPSQIMPPRTVCSTKTGVRRPQEDVAMVDVVPQKEKVNGKPDGPKAANEDIPFAVDKNQPHAVVSPLPAPNLTSLLTGHTGQDVDMQDTDIDTAADSTQSTDKGTAKQVNYNVKSPIKKKTKKSKTTKEDKSTKRDRSG